MATMLQPAAAVARACCSGWDGQHPRHGIRGVAPSFAAMTLRSQRSAHSCMPTTGRSCRCPPLGEVLFLNCGYLPIADR